jgi:transcription initiation factor TFIID subunit TAF12
MHSELTAVVPAAACDEGANNVRICTQVAQSVLAGLSGHVANPQAQQQQQQQQQQQWRQDQSSAAEIVDSAKASPYSVAAVDDWLGKLDAWDGTKEEEEDAAVVADLR